MKNKKIKNTLINHLMLHGNKKTCETILLKSLKIIQKFCKKSHRTLFKLAITNATSAFRIAQLKQKKRKIKINKNKKEIPTFILNNHRRIIWSLKFISQTIKKAPTNKFYNNLKQEIIFDSQNKGDAVKMKTELHKQIVAQKRLFLHYRW